MWTSRPDERLRSWQDFRTAISKKSIEQAVFDTQHLWSYAPYVAHYLTTDNIKEWPGPWELVYENYYCDLAKALGMLYTLYLCDHAVDVELRIYKNPEDNSEVNLVYIDKGKYVINYEFDSVVNNTQVSADLQLRKIITSEELGLQQLK